MENPIYDNSKPKFYGRRRGKRMTELRQSAYNETLPQMLITLPAEGVVVDPRTFFDTPVKEVWFEIGFGSGEHLLHHALNNPDIGMIGCEPFLNGVGALCMKIREHNIKNIRIWPDDARLLLPHIKEHSLGRFFVLNGDPWPKTRHAARRFVQRETLDIIHSLLKTGAEFRMSSDHPVLAAWQLEQAYFHEGFEWLAKCANDWRERPADFPETRYQKKGAVEGRPTVFLNFKAKA